ncbi:MAG: class I SAM-dependent methyltransferase [Proteobacteria bacterium]|nr:class I SAM-dependent methyltransferase [Pseudomonadota bacterium]
MNDMRGHTVIAHLRERFPDLKPRRILEMGCTVGNSLCAVAQTFPNAEAHGIDVGAGLLRYAHARAAHLGVPVHFSQQSAEQTDFEDASFDLIFSCAMLHETSTKAVPRIFAECYRYWPRAAWWCIWRCPFAPVRRRLSIWSVQTSRRAITTSPSGWVPCRRTTRRLRVKPGFRRLRLVFRTRPTALRVLINALSSAAPIRVSTGRGTLRQLARGRHEGGIVSRAYRPHASSRPERSAACAGYRSTSRYAIEHGHVADIRSGGPAGSVSSAHERLAAAGRHRPGCC